MIVPSLVFTVTVKSELTGNEGSCTIELDPNPDGMIEKFHEAVRNCLIQIAGNEYIVENKEVGD